MDPDLHSMVDVEGARRYLADYFGQEANIDIFWGSPADFLTALMRELESAGVNAAGEAPAAAGEHDEWDF
jgi:hypothetical protein